VDSVGEMKNHNNFDSSFASYKMPRTVVLAGMVAFIASACGGSNGSASPPSTSSTHPSASDAASNDHHAEHAHDPSKGHHHRFDDAAGWSKVFDDPTRDEWQKPTQVIALMAIAPGMTVADVGAGTGYFVPHLSRAVGANGKVLGEDIEPSMVKWIDERAKHENLANVQGLLGAKDDPKLPPGSVDRILVVDTWHHIDDRPDFAKKLAAALKPGGAVFIVDYTLESPHGPPQHARLAPEAVGRDLASAGLTIEVIQNAGLAHQYVVRGSTKR
jgi:SAM-dependent methyltransferase